MTKIKQEFCEYFKEFFKFIGTQKIFLKEIEETDGGIKFVLQIFEEVIPVNISGDEKHFRAIMEDDILPRYVTSCRINEEKIVILKEFQSLNSSKSHISPLSRHLHCFVKQSVFLQSDEITRDSDYLYGVRAHNKEYAFRKILQFFFSVGLKPDTISKRSAMSTSDMVLLYNYIESWNFIHTLQLLIHFGCHLLGETSNLSKTRLEVLLLKCGKISRFRNVKGYLYKYFISHEKPTKGISKAWISLGNFLLAQLAQTLHVHDFVSDTTYMNWKWTLLRNDLDWLKKYINSTQACDIASLKSGLVLKYCAEKHLCIGSVPVCCYEAIANFLGIRLKEASCEMTVDKTNIASKKSSAQETLQNICLPALKEYFSYSNEFNFQAIVRCKFFPETLKERTFIPIFNFPEEEYKKEQAYITVLDYLRKWYLEFKNVVSN